jgi:hypothetical protein
MVKDKEIYCKNCPHHWKLSDGGKDTYVCHKCGYNNKEMIKLKDILNEMISEMGMNDWGVQTIENAFKTGNEDMKNKICLAFTKKPINFFIEKYSLKNSDETWKFIEKNILELEKEDLDDKLKNLGLYNLEEACWKGYRKDGMKKKGNRMVPNCVRISEAKKKDKVNPAYLTKDASAMRKEIDRVKKLKSDDPSAYGKWDADYSDKDKTKKYKTKKSAATSAYEKRFGKKEK